MDIVSPRWLIVEMGKMKEINSAFHHNLFFPDKSQIIFAWMVCSTAFFTRKYRRLDFYCGIII